MTFVHGGLDNTSIRGWTLSAWTAISCCARGSCVVHGRVDVFWAVDAKTGEEIDAKK